MCLKRFNKLEINNQTVSSANCFFDKSKIDRQIIKNML